VDLNLGGKTALVTGASRGIGRLIAHSMGQHGAYVIGTATRPEGAKSIERGFSEAQIQGRGCVLDVAKPDSVEGFAAVLRDVESPPVILVNNAGITRDKLMLRMKEEDWDEVINTNLNSVYRLSKLCLRGMMKAGYGRIIPRPGCSVLHAPWRRRSVAGRSPSTPLPPDSLKRT